ncbi:MAG: imidazoleglycerol-phosphate dehydratase HisB [Desulfarculaceae bacterium]|nr:imidazoleglycerol-phosphate dehydratase HisB [Desulfarculaceae bacterium]
MGRNAEVTRKTKETDISVKIDLDGTGTSDISTSIPFFDHMLDLFAVHGFMDLTVKAAGDIDVDYHHTVEDVGLVLGEALSNALGDRKGICRYGEASVPMDEALTRVDVDFSNRPYLVYNVPDDLRVKGSFDACLAKEFFRAFSVKGGLNLHVNTVYGENEHHVVESIFKAFARAVNAAVTLRKGPAETLSSKGAL